MHRPGSTSALVFSCFCVLSAQAQATDAEPRGDVIDRVVAVVQLRQGVAERRTGAPRSPPDVISLSGLQFEARVALIQRGAVRAASEPLDAAALRSALENGISERLLAGEAEMLGAFRVDPAEVETAVRGFRERFESEAKLRAFLQAHEADLQALGRVLERHLRAIKVLDGKVRLRSQVTESEIRAFYDENRGTLRGGYDELRPLLRERLVRERYQQLVEAELAELRRLHEVRKVAPFARAGAQGERG
jgi:hypothetical protein